MARTNRGSVTSAEGANQGRSMHQQQDAYHETASNDGRIATSAQGEDQRRWLQPQLRPSSPGTSEYYRPVFMQGDWTPQERARMNKETEYLGPEAVDRMAREVAAQGLPRCLSLEPWRRLFRSLDMRQAARDAARRLLETDR